MHYYYWTGEGWNGFDFFFSLLMSVLWILLIVWVVRTVMHSRHWKHRDDPESAEETARLRLAKGEITEEEYRRLRKTLSE
jgi:uncharacterized membrane protein